MALSDAEIGQVNGAIGGRRNFLIDLEVKRPFPSLDTTAAPPTFDLGRLNVSLALFAKAADALTVGQANRYLEDVVSIIKSQPIYKGAGDDFHFEIAQYLFRIVRMYGSHGVVGHQLSMANEDRIKGIFFDWAKSECRLSVPLAMNTWDIWGSENHSAQRDSSCWAASDLLASDPTYASSTYSDGSTAAKQLNAWNKFLCYYLSQRLQHGALVEYFSPTYSQYTLNNFYLYADFAEDSELRRLATALLNLWWAMWAEEQVDGVHGGSKTRNYAKVIPEGTPMITAAWLYFGLGTVPRNLPPGESGAVMSSYRPPAVVSDIALDAKGRGSYDVTTWALGLAKRKMTADGTYYVDEQHNGVLRFAHVTPDYVMGLGIVPLLSTDKWTAISSQNRWAGLVLAGGGPAARIVPAVVSSRGEKEYNALFGIQAGGTQLVRAVPAPSGVETDRLEVWIGKPLQRVEGSDWIYVNSSAFVALRPLWGGWHWDDKDPQWMIPNDSSSPVLIHAAEKSLFANLQKFKESVGKISIARSGDVVTVKENTGADLSIGLGKDSTLKIGGIPVDFAIKPVISSPFIKIDGVIQIRKSGRALAIDPQVR